MLLNLGLLMSVIKHLKETTLSLLTAQLLRPRKFFFLSHSFHNSTTFVHPFSTFLSDTSLFDAQFLHLSVLPTVINFRHCNQFLIEIDSCCYGSEYVLPRNSYQLHFLVLTAFLNVIPVSHFSWF